MPELPEVETVCRGLQAKLPGAFISRVEVLRTQSIEYPIVEEFESALVGHEFISIYRRGKYILITLDRGAGLACHLRMSGRLLVKEKKSEQGRFLRVRIFLKDGRELHFEDMRVFGRLWYKPADKSFEDVIPTLGELGVEPLDQLTSRDLSDLLRRKTQPIKTALLDQRVIAGIGNIYADESLFQSKIHPLREAGSLTQPEVDLLVKMIRQVLNKAIKNRGTTLRDYTDSEGVNGNYQHKAFVYGRDGEPCRVCHEEIKRIKVGGRSTHFCANCQPQKGMKKVAKSKTTKTK